jgi:hypothetical protein
LLIPFFLLISSNCFSNFADQFPVLCRSWPKHPETGRFELKPRPSYNLFIKAVLIALFPVFFAVQLFFNLGSYRSSNTQDNYFFGWAIAIKDQPAKAGTHAAHHHRSFRLNKHFQPESLPSYDLFVIESPVEFICSKNQKPEPDHFIPSPFFETQALRGPPFLNNFS